jgi:glucans biosynthesis protein
MKSICGAKTRSGHACKTSSITGRTRCRMHGGTNNGAPLGNKNALKHGGYTKEAITKRAECMQLIRNFKALRDDYDL